MARDALTPEERAEVERVRKRVEGTVYDNDTLCFVDRDTLLRILDRPTASKAET